MVSSGVQNSERHMTVGRLGCLHTHATRGETRRGVGRKMRGHGRRGRTDADARSGSSNSETRTHTHTQQSADTTDAAEATRRAHTHTLAREHTRTHTLPILPRRFPHRRADDRVHVILHTARLRLFTHTRTLYRHSHYTIHTYVVSYRV